MAYVPKKQRAGQGQKLRLKGESLGVQGLGGYIRDNGKENGNYREYQGYMR